MNITKQIINNLEAIGYNGEVSTISRYFIDENIKCIYGTSMMNQNDYCLSFEDDSIDLQSIFKEGHFIISVSYDSTQSAVTLKCDHIQKNNVERVFEIVDSPHATINNVNLKDGVHKVLSYNKADVSFSLEVSHEQDGQKVVDYKASLNPIYSKTGNTDWFSYSREFPPVKREKSFLKRLVNEFTNNGSSRQIVTCSDGSIGYEEFPENIFGTLIQDANRVFENKEESPKQRIRI